MYHHLLWHLDKDLFKPYKLRYDYARHNYFLFRNSRFLIYDAFIIIRTSKKCFRLTYYHIENGFIYKSFKSARKCAEYMNELVEKA